jgi:cell division protease FtsH|eukprot:CAMPEP_0174285892 /NCGR_PEP_ID=MMETSP0809-20121228/9867_1 /TAXON_ID=73025 ORGANISM="Eutreptiella gymnastica-like, Strain CCMP1594" /NCGR_SAMPLE_ID=MMETSP0809 /ASSEMBLY_ACC=CAM_ASM_000658 /LENGTH=740 /DNA_ID=CAMNT_0015381781 /DNA_START=18 /DNA_END=2240 /DNA_ORIENTATION=-
MAYLKPENYATLEIQGTESLPVLERASAQKWKPVLALGVLVAVSVAAYNAIVPQSAPTTSLAMRPMQQVRPAVAGAVLAGMTLTGQQPALAADIAPPAAVQPGSGASVAGADAPALTDSTTSNGRMSYSRFLELLEQDSIAEVQFNEDRASLNAVLRTDSPRTKVVQVQIPPPDEPALVASLRTKGVNIAVKGPDAAEQAGSFFLRQLAFPLVLLAGLFLIVRNSNQGGPMGGPGMGLGKTKARFEMEPETGVKFDDVAGVNEAKQDLVEVVEFLKAPDKYTAVGAKIPKGVLLTGPPGTGKTLLAKAVAGEAGVPFFNCSGSEFVEMFVGVGASRVRDLFKKANENAPCLIFIDEIDAVGRSRGAGIGQGNDEREQTLNQILTEMDGFDGNNGVIVLAATNRPDILDPALLRPGRFDRQTSVDVPDIAGRKAILAVHSKNKPLADDVSVDVIAMRTPGFSGADLSNLMNESAILAGRRNKEKISNAEVDDSIDRIIAGMEGNPIKDGKSKSLVAYHEVGHALCATLTPGHDPVQKVTLVPRGQARGLTWFIPGDDPSLVTKGQLQARIVGALGGRAAEEVVFGEAEITTGAGGDLQQVTNMAKAMVTQFGMSDIGPWALQNGQEQDMVMRMMARNQMSEKVAAAIDRNVKEIAMEAYDIALGHVRNNMAAMDMAVERLCEIETLTGDEFREIVQSCGITIPMENVEAVERQKLGIQEAEERLEKTAAAVSAAFKTLDAK